MVNGVHILKMLSAASQASSSSSSGIVDNSLRWVFHQHYIHMASTQQLKVLSLDKNLGLCTQYKGTRRLLKNIYTVMNLCVNRIVYTLGNITALKIVNSLKYFRV